MQRRERFGDLESQDSETKDQRLGIEGVVVEILRRYRINRRNEKNDADDGGNRSASGREKFTPTGHV